MLPESGRECGTLTTEARYAAHDSAHHDASTGGGAAPILGSRWCCRGVGIITRRQGAKTFSVQIFPLVIVVGGFRDLHNMHHVASFRVAALAAQGHTTYRSPGVENMEELAARCSAATRLDIIPTACSHRRTVPRFQGGQSPWPSLHRATRARCLYIAEVACVHWRLTNACTSSLGAARPCAHTIQPKEARGRAEQPHPAPDKAFPCSHRAVKGRDVSNANVWGSGPVS